MHYSWRMTLVWVLVLTSIMYSKIGIEKKSDCSGDQEPLVVYAQEHKEAKNTLAMCVGSRIALRNNEVDLVDERVFIYPYRDGDHVILPLKYVAEATGYEVLWDNAERRIVMDNGMRRMKLSLTGEIDMADITYKKLETMVIRNGVSFVSLEELEVIFDVTFLVEGDAIYLDHEPVDRAIFSESLKVPINTRRESDIPWIRDNPFVAHALGAVKLTTYTNTLEGFESAYKRGIRVFEVDVVYTSDEVLVAKHDWTNQWYINFDQEVAIDEESSDGETKLSHQAFMDLPILTDLTPLSIESLSELMATYEDVLLIIDTKELGYVQVYKDINQVMMDKGIDISRRIVPQVYDITMAQEINNFYDYKWLIFSLYKSNYSKEEVLSAMRQYEMDLIVMPFERATSETLDYYIENNIDVMVHTINAPISAQEMFDLGVVGIYTDYLDDTHFTWDK